MQHGGKYIAKGEYGCVYKPALKCVGNEKRRKDTITKVMKREEAEKEMEKVKQIDKIDPEFVYHLPTPTLCEPKGLSKKHDNLMKDCNFIHTLIENNPSSWKDKVRFLQYKDGGISMKKFMDRHHDRINDVRVNTLMKKMKVLFFGIKDMFEKGFIHGDINFNNIVIQPDTYEMKYIDFGLSLNVEDFIPKRSFPSFGHHVRPLDMGFLESYPLRKVKVYYKNRYTRFQGRTYDLLLNKQFDKVDAVLRSICANDYSSINLKNSILIEGSRQYTSIKDLYEGLERGDPHLYLDGVRVDEFYKDYYDLYERKCGKDFGKFSHYLMRRIDVYSLGLFLMYVWEFLKGQKYSLRKPRELNNVESKFYDLIRNMTRANVTKRIDPVDAYREYVNILKLVKKNKTRRREKKSRSDRSRKRTPSSESSIEYGVHTKHLYKECDEGQVYNVITKRCITDKHPNAKLIREIGLDKDIRSSGVKERLRDSHSCPTGEVLNIVSDNCVDKNGALGRRIINLGLAPKKQMTRRDRQRLQHKISRKNRPLFKPCAEDHLYNPVTEKCITKESTIGKRIQRIGLDGKVDHEKLEPHLRKGEQCSEKEIYNVVSNRCVERDGHIGKRIQAINLYKTSPQ